MPIISVGCDISVNHAAFVPLRHDISIRDQAEFIAENAKYLKFNSMAVSAGKTRDGTPKYRQRHLNSSERRLFAHKQLKKIVQHYADMSKEDGVRTIFTIEDYTHSENFRTLAYTGEVIGCFKTMIQMQGMEITEFWTKTIKKKKIYRTLVSFNPNDVKVFIAGLVKDAGGKKNNRIPLIVFKDYGHEFKNDDGSDAFVLALMGLIRAEIFHGTLSQQEIFEKYNLAKYQRDKIKHSLKEEK